MDGFCGSSVAGRGGCWAPSCPMMLGRAFSSLTTRSSLGVSRVPPLLLLAPAVAGLPAAAGAGAATPVLAGRSPAACVLCCALLRLGGSTPAPCMTAARLRPRSSSAACPESGRMTRLAFGSSRASRAPAGTACTAGGQRQPLFAYVRHAPHNSGGAAMPVCSSSTRRGWARLLH
jgi:hypothetical protein